MRLSVALLVVILSAGIANASRAGSDADDIVILSVQPRSADVRPVIVAPPPGQPAQGGAPQSAQSRKAGNEVLRGLPENRPAEKTRPDMVTVAL